MPRTIFLIYRSCMLYVPCLAPTHLLSLFSQFFFGTTAKPLQPARADLPPHAQPTDVDAETSPLAELIRASVLRSDVDCRKDLLANTCLVGGGSLIDGKDIHDGEMDRGHECLRVCLSLCASRTNHNPPGMSPRLNYELGELLPTHLKCKLQVIFGTRCDTMNSITTFD